MSGRGTSRDDSTETAQRICAGLRKATDLTKRAGALSHVSRLDTRKKDMRTRKDVLRLGGLDVVIECLSQDQLGAKAANALGALCMEDTVALYVLEEKRSVVIPLLESLVMSDSLYAIGDASFTLGMLVMIDKNPASLFPDVLALSRHLSGQCLSSIEADQWTEPHRNMRVFVCVLLHKLIVVAPSATREIIVDGGFVGVLLHILLDPRHKDDLLHIAIASLRVLASDVSLREQLLKTRVLAATIRFSVDIESDIWGLMPKEIENMKSATKEISRQLTQRSLA
eukprot:CFRG6757T1